MGAVGGAVVGQVGVSAGSSSSSSSKGLRERLGRWWKGGGGAARCKILTCKTTYDIHYHH